MGGCAKKVTLPRQERGGHAEDVEAMGQRGCLVVDLATCFGEVER
jgi:hypothetical protein